MKFFVSFFWFLAMTLEYKACIIEDLNFTDATLDYTKKIWQ